MSPSRRSRAPIHLALILALCIGALPIAPAHAQDKDAQASAELLDVEAQAFYDAANYRAALSRWKQVYETWPNPATLWNIARCYEELGALLQARGAFSLYLKFKTLSRQDIRDARTHIAAIEKRLDAWKEAEAKARRSLDGNALPEAEAHYRQALALYTASTTLWDLGVLLERQSRPEEALAVFERLAELPDLEQAEVQRVTTRLEALRTSLRPRDTSPSPDVTPDPDPVHTDPTPDPTHTTPRSTSSPLLVGLGWGGIGLGVVGIGLGAWIRVGIGDDVEELTVLSAAQGPNESNQDFDRRATKYSNLRNAVESDLTTMWIAFGVGAVAAVTGVTLLVLDGTSGEAPSQAVLRLGPGSIGFEARF